MLHHVLIKPYAAAYARNEGLVYLKPIYIKTFLYKTEGLGIAAVTLTVMLP